MTVKETVVKIKAAKSIEDLAQFESDGRKGIINALADRKNELSVPEEAPVAEAPVAETPVAEAPVAEAPVAEAPVAETPVAEAPVAKKAIKVKENKKDYSAFLNKIHYECTRTSIITYAGDYFGDELKSTSYDTVTGNVAISLKNGDKLNVRGI